MNILHVEDHPLFSDGLSRLLAGANITLSHISNPKKLLEEISNDIDLLLLDFYLPDMNGIKLMKEIRERGILIPIAFLSATEEVRDIKQCIDEGAMGFISKSLSSEAIVSAIANILDGERFLSTEHQQAISAIRCPDHASVAKRYALSHKQLNVLGAMREGLSNNEIASGMGLTESAVKYHIGILFQSFAVKNRVECLRYAEKIGLIAG